MKQRTSILVLVLILLAVAPVYAAPPEGWLPCDTSGGEAQGIVTYPHSSYADGLVQLEFDWRENDGAVLRFRCINGSSEYLWGAVFEWNDGTQQYEEVWYGYCPPQDVVELPVKRFDIGWDLVDGGLIMGPYSIRTRWPDPGPG